MTKSLLLLALAIFAANVQAEEINHLRLRFTRGGTDANSVTVSVTDANGNAVSGVSATLESIKHGNGDPTSASTSECALKNAGTMVTSTAILCPDYTNVQNQFVLFTFKLTGLSSFKVNHADVTLSGINVGGLFHNKGPRTFDVSVFNSSTPSSSSTIATKTGVDVCVDCKVTGSGTSEVRYDNSHYWELTTSDGATIGDYVVVCVKRTATDGSFFGFSELDLYNGYKLPTATVTGWDEAKNNLTTFSSSSNTVFSSDADAYIAKKASTDKVTVCYLDEGVSLPAKQGAILATAKDSVYAYVSTTAASTQENLLVGGGDETLALTESGTSYYIFNKNATSNQAQFSPLSSSSTTLAANKAALAVTGGVQNVLSIDFDRVTAISGTTLQQPADDRIYDLSGRRVKKLTPGVYVRNGEKFIVK